MRKLIVARLSSYWLCTGKPRGQAYKTSSCSPQEIPSLLPWSFRSTARINSISPFRSAAVDFSVCAMVAAACAPAGTSSSPPSLGMLIQRAAGEVRRMALGSTSVDAVDGCVRLAWDDWGHRQDNGSISQNWRKNSHWDNTW